MKVSANELSCVISGLPDPNYYRVGEQLVRCINAQVPVGAQVAETFEIRQLVFVCDEWSFTSVEAGKVYKMNQWSFDLKL